MLASGIAAVTAGGWSQDWLWGVFMIVLTVTLHTGCLVLLGDLLIRLEPLLSRWLGHRRLLGIIVLTASLSLAVALLFSLAAMLWALAYLLVGAFLHFHVAVYYSLTMITTTGYDGIDLPLHWRLMGMLEAVSGVLLAGISTAFLFAVLQKVWPHR